MPDELASGCKINKLHKHKVYENTKLSDINYMDAIINGYKIIRDGTIVLNPRDTLSFTIEDIKFNFVFVEDESGKKKIEDVRDSDSLTLKVYNFNNVVGTGFSEPIELATLDSGEYLYLQFAVYQIAKEIKVFHYSWSTKKKEKEDSHE